MSIHFDGDVEEVWWDGPIVEVYVGSELVWKSEAV